MDQNRVGGVGELRGVGRDLAEDRLRDCARDRVSGTESAGERKPASARVGEIRTLRVVGTARFCENDLVPRYDAVQQRHLQFQRLRGKESAKCGFLSRFSLILLPKRTRLGENGTRSTDCAGTGQRGG